MKTSVILASLLLAAASATVTANARQIKRTPIPNSNFPTSVALPLPGALVEIDLIAARVKP